MTLDKPYITGHFTPVADEITATRADGRGHPARPS